MWPSPVLLSIDMTDFSMKPKSLSASCSSTAVDSTSESHSSQIST